MGSGLLGDDGTDSGQRTRPGSMMSGSRPGSRFGMRTPSSTRRVGRGGEHRKRGVNVEVG